MHCGARIKVFSPSMNMDNSRDSLKFSFKREIPHVRSCVVVIAFFIALLPVANAFSRPVIFGIHAGAGISELRGEGFNDCITTIHRMQYGTELDLDAVTTKPLYTPAMGVSASTMFNGFAGATLEFWYRLKGMQYDVAGEAADCHYDLSFHYFTVPVKALFIMPGYSSFFPYLYAGLYGSMLLDALHRQHESGAVSRYGSTFTRATTTETVFRNHAKWYDAGLIVGGGGEIGLGVRGILLDACLEIGASDIAEYERHMPLFSHSLRTTTLYLTLGYEIRFFSF